MVKRIWHSSIFHSLVLVLCSFYWLRKDSSSVSLEKMQVLFPFHCIWILNVSSQSHVIIFLVFFFTLRAGIGFDKAQLFPQLTGYVFGFNWALFSSAQMKSTWKKPYTWIWSATELDNHTLICPEPEDWKERFLNLFREDLNWMFLLVII